MGYPMSYSRVIKRNDLAGDYDQSPRGNIAGDLRRLESDSRDDVHLRGYALIAGITQEQAEALLDAFFAGQPMPVEAAARRLEPTP